MKKKIKKIKKGEEDEHLWFKKGKEKEHLEFLLKNFPKKYFQCAICGKIYKKGWSDEKAAKEYDENFPNMENMDKVLICDDCYQPKIEEVKEIAKNDFETLPEEFKNFLKNGLKIDSGFGTHINLNSVESGKIELPEELDIPEEFIEDLENLTKKFAERFPIEIRMVEYTPIRIIESYKELRNFIKNNYPKYNDFYLEIAPMTYKPSLYGTNNWIFSTIIMLSKKEEFFTHETLIEVDDCEIKVSYDNKNPELVAICTAKMNKIIPIFLEKED